MAKLIEYKPGTTFPGVIGRTVAESTPACPSGRLLGLNYVSNFPVYGRCNPQ